MAKEKNVKIGKEIKEKIEAAIIEKVTKGVRFLNEQKVGKKKR